MILRLTPTTAALIGETAAEWNLLEKQVSTGRWTTGARTDEGWLRQLATELGVPLREEGVVRVGSGASRARHMPETRSTRLGIYRLSVRQAGRQPLPRLPS
jgi:hypothetical protein